MRTIKEIIVRCSATKAGKDFRAADIDRWHREQGYQQIGYHYVVDLDGTVERGRYLSMPGAHCKGHNAHSIGICYVGGVNEDGKPTDTRTSEQKAALLKLITNLIRMHRCVVHGHRHYNKNKECPCFDAEAEYNGIYKRMLEATNVG